MNSGLYENTQIFLAHSLALEQEAAERMYELADTMAVHNNQALHKLLTTLAAYSEDHALEMKALCQDETLPRFKAWEYSWPDDESPEIFHYASIDYLMREEEALQTALEVEQSAEAFYRNITKNTVNSEIKQLAEQFASEEQSHANSIAAQLSALKAEGQNSSTVIDQTEFDPPHMPE